MLTRFNTLWLLCLMLSNSHLAHSVNINEAEYRFTGNAFDIKTGTFLYTEQHTLQTIDGNALLSTLYTDTEKNTIGTRNVEFIDDKVANYTLIQAPIDYQESITRQTGSALFKQNKKGKKTAKNRPNKNINEVVIDAGFSNFITRNWQTLIKGETLKFEFASIDQLGFVMLQVRYIKTVQKGEQTVAQFAMTAANPLIKMFMKPIKIGYYTNSKQLAFYQGISNLQDNNGRYYKVRIEFPFINNHSNTQHSVSKTSHALPQ